MSNKSDFRKILGAADLLVVAFGAMIGWGWVVSSGGWIQNAGVIGTVLGFVIGGVMIYFVGMTYAELTPAMPQTGGGQVFTYAAFGRTASFVCTWALILSYIGVVCFEAVSLPAIIRYLFPAISQVKLYTIAGSDVYLTEVIIAAGFAIAILLLNVWGIKAASIMQTILTIAIAGVGVILVLASLINGSPKNLEGQTLVGEGFDAIKSIMAVAVVAPFYLFGFDVIPQVAEEVRIPLKKVGTMMLLSIICAVTFYGLVVFAVGYILDPAGIEAAVNGNGLVTATAMECAFNSEIMAKTLIIGGLCGVVTSWNSFLIGGSRAIFSMAENKMLPAVFSKIDSQHKTPVNALVLIGVLSVIAPFFGKTMLVWISNVSSFACCLAYCFVALSFLALRYKKPDMHRPFKVRHPKFVGMMAVALSGIMVVMYLIPGTQSSLVPEEWVILSGWTLLGALFYFMSKCKYRDAFGKAEEK